MAHSRWIDRIVVAMSRRAAVSLALALLVLAGCGGSDEQPKGGARGGSERAAVEKAARDYIVEQQSDEDDTEQPGAISFEHVEVDGESADVRARSSLTGNKYKLTMSKSGANWTGLSIFTDVPDEPAGGGDPAQGAGREASTDQVEQQIAARLLKPLGIRGKVECPSTVRLRRGNNFRCKVLGGNRKASVLVTQKDDQGSLNYKVTAKP